MKSGCKYQHSANTDTAIIVHEVNDDHPDYVSIQASWFHLRWDIVYETREYLIKREEINNWRRIDDEKSN